MVNQTALATGICVTTLGGFSAAWGERAIPPGEWSRKRAAALFRGLIGAAGFRLSADAVVERLWPESTPLAGRTNLRVKIFEIRAIFARYAPPGVDPLRAPPVLFEGGVVALDPQYGPFVDAFAFERAGLAALERGDAASVLAALEGYGGAYLPEERDEPTLALRDRFARVHRALGLHAATALAAHPERVERLLGPLFEAYPYDEEVALALASVRAALGRRVDLRDLYATHERALHARCGLQPSTRLAALAGLRNGASALTSSAPEGARLGDADEERSRPVAGRRLPPLIGRAPERAAWDAALAALARGETRCIAVTGRAGVGKTRLAREFESAARAAGVATAFARAFRDIPLDLLVDDLLDSLGEGAAATGFGDESSALAGAFAARLERGPVVAILDDAHLAPASLLAALDAFAAASGNARFGLVFVAREGAPLGADLVLDLEPLGLAEVRAILADSFDAPVDEALLDLFAALWPGDVALALGAASLARANGCVVRAPEGWTLRAGAETFELIPERHRLGIVRRVLALEPAAVETVKALAFAGERATGETVALLTSRDRATVARAFDEIARAGLGERIDGALALPLAVRAVANELLSKRRRSLFVERLANGIARTFR